MPTNPPPIELDYAVEKRPLSYSALACFIASLLLWVPLGVEMVLDNLPGVMMDGWQIFLLESFIVIPSFICLTLSVFVRYCLGRTQRRGKALAVAAAWISGLSAVLIILLSELFNL